MFVTCDIDSCAYYRDGNCGKKSIHVTRKTFSGFHSGEREWAPACENYKEIDEEE